MSSSIAGDGYKDEWAYDDVESPTTPSPLRTADLVGGRHRARSEERGGNVVVRAFRTVFGLGRSDMEHEREEERERREDETRARELEEKTPLSMRARVYGPERVVLDPRECWRWRAQRAVAARGTLRP